MTQRVNYSVIIPTYNEKDNLPYLIVMLIDAFHAAEETFEVLLIDDGSPDGTENVYKQLQKLYSEERLLLLQRGKKLGLGSAYMDGIEKTTGKFIFILDADLSHNPVHIPQFIAKQKQNNYDIVTGTRYCMGGGVCGWNFKRIFVSRVANYLASVMLNPGVSDLTGSFRLYKREVLKELMKEMQGKGYVFQMEVMVRASCKKYSIGECPIVFVDRLYGSSKLGKSEVLQYLKGLFSLFWEL